MHLKDAVVKTIKYSSYFNYQLDQDDLHHWLITSSFVSKNNLNRLVKLKISPQEKKKHKQLRLNSVKKINYLLDKRKYLSLFPGIQFIGVTGSTAAYNAKKKDDIDIFIITSPNTLWIIRPLFLFYLSFFFRVRKRHTPHNQTKNFICPNLWLDLNNLQIPISSQNLYTAHEVLQVIPLINKSFAYENFIHSNNWSKKYLANAFCKVAEKHPKKLINRHPFSILFYPINYLMYIFQYMFMYKHIGGERVGLGYAYFHNKDYNSPINDHLKSKISI